jgi:dolichol-phosphate mannosyltransferase
MSLISVVVPVYNEQECLEALHARLRAVADASADKFEFIFVDDGSRDRSREIIHDLASRNDSVRYVFFSRNFGHEAATTAGIDHASGEAVIIIDADLQDPPEVIHELLAKWREGYHVVYAQRRRRAGETVFKKFTSWAFYRTLRWLSKMDLPRDTGDFRLMDRAVVDRFRRCRERSRFVRGLVAWTGFRSAAVMYDRDARLAGETKYNIRKLVLLALDATVGFSNVPLRLGILLGLAACAFAMVMIGVIIVQRIFWGQDMWHGYAFLAVSLYFFSGLNLLLVGLMGEYVGRAYREVQHRPIYIPMEKSPQLPADDEGWAATGTPVAPARQAKSTAAD